MYLPKSQLTPNLYTNGELWYEDTLQPYTGYYFKTSKGIYYTGRTPSDRPNVILIDPTTIETPGLNNPAFKGDPVVTAIYVNDPGPPPSILDNPLYNGELIYNYYKLNNPTPSITPNPFIPYYNPVLPTQQDYQNGEFRRYFCKKTNEVIYVEINQDTFDKLIAKDPQVLWQLYQPFNITWQLTGNQEQVARINKNSVELVSFRNRFPRLDEYLKFDYIKYYNQLGNSTSGSYINGVNQGYVLDNRDGRSTGVFNSQNDSGSVRRDNSMPR
jgi:hypothetical protein